MPYDANSTTDAGSVAAYFDELYAPQRRYWWRRGDPYSIEANDYPTSLLTQLTLRLTRDREPGRALDLGAGEGADSIRLARLGYTVTAVDISGVAADKIKGYATAAGVDVSVETADISEYHSDGQFDVVVCNGVLHYIGDKASVIERIQASTRPGGLNVVSSWSAYTRVPACHNSIPVYPDDEDGVITGAYKGWELKFIYFERGKPEGSHGGMPAHTHSHIKIIAEKPKP